MSRTPDAPLGGVSVDDFLARHWQRRPLLIRGALPAADAPISVDRLLALAGRDDVESRLITRRGRRWSLAHGPFAPDELPPATQPGWTLLVQGVDLHHDAVAALLRRFSFVPHARVDDAMISYATDGGGVGPHVDSYDVFLLQTHGRRRWRIGNQRDRSFVPGVPLKILQRFEPTDEWVLEPGDMLYLPPGWAHDGVAIGECATCSIGFRAPSRGELLRAFLADAADAVGKRGDQRFGDAGRARARRPGRLPDDLRAFARDAIGRWRPSAREIDAFLGRFLTEPKASVFFEPPVRALTRTAFEARAASGLVLDRRTRLLVDGASVFINGEHERATPGERAWLARLADARELPAAQAAQALATPGCRERLHEWYRAGWLHPARRP